MPDPITVIVEAVAMGASAGATGVAATAVKDAYGALKAWLQGNQGDKVARAVSSLEEKPSSEARRGVLKEELDESGAGRDAELMRLAGELIELLGKGPGTTCQATVTGSGAVAQGPGAHAAGARGIAGDVSGSTIIMGSGSVVRRPEDVTGG